MQSVISQVAYTFVDDAVALATGLGRITAGLTIDALAAARSRVMAPVDRLARACDVAGILAARDAAKMRSHVKAVHRQNTATSRRIRGRFDVFGIFAALRTLRELT
jgi:hypothetical protein